MGRKPKRPEVEGYQDHESAVKKIAADFNLDPVQVESIIYQFFGGVTRVVNKLQNVYLESFGIFKKTKEGVIAAVLKDRELTMKRRKEIRAYYLRYADKIRARSRIQANQRKKEKTELDPWELNELDMQRHPEKWKDRITLEK